MRAMIVSSAGDRPSRDLARPFARFNIASR